MATPAESALQLVAADLDSLGADWALVGGLAVSVRAIPRFTKDLDFVVAVADDHAAERVVHGLGTRGYAPLEIIEQEYVDRLSTARLIRTGTDVFVDLLFASSGIESEVVAGASRIEVLPGLMMPVATTGHLIALKLLAGRNQDLTDLESLVPLATDADLAEARTAARLIHQRGFHRDEPIVADLERLLAELRRT